MKRESIVEALGEEALLKKRPIQELSVVIQGEGKLAGVPHLLVRFTGCKLRCQFRASFCDTWYASWRPEQGGQFSLYEVIDFIEKNRHIEHVFLTGGGPTLQGSLLSDVVDICKAYGLYVTIETEGSEYVETKCDLISLSPKFSNSTPILGSKKPWGGVVTKGEVARHEEWRKNYDAMKKLIENQVSRDADYQVKPVISEPRDLAELIELQDILGIPNNMCYLMPEGDTDEKLQKSREWLFELCIKHGYNYTDRLHVIVYGDKRGV